MESIVSTALARRPDVQSAYAAQQQSLAEYTGGAGRFHAESVRLGHRRLQLVKPGCVGAAGCWRAGAQPRISPATNFGGAILAGVTVPLYDGGTRAAVLAQARAQADSADAALTQVQEEAVRQIAVCQ